LPIEKNMDERCNYGQHIHPRSQGRRRRQTPGMGRRERSPGIGNLRCGQLNLSVEGKF
jgi:hypothetical protein